MLEISNQREVALVTGGGARIGAAIVRALAAAGYAVVIHHRSGQAAAEALAAEITGAGGRAAVAHADLARRDERNALVAKARGFFGPLTLLVNNASSYQPDSAIDLDEGLWDRHFAIHAEAPAFLSRDFAAQLPEGVAGNIINVIDERVLDLSPAYFSYTLSKSVLWTLTRTLAQSFAPAIRVNAVAPGPALAPPGVAVETFTKRQTQLPLGRAGGPEEIAAAVLAILALPSLTGQMLTLDGGEHLEWPAHRAPTPRRRP